MTPYIDVLWKVLFQSALTIVLVFGAVGFAAGVGLIASSAGTVRFFRAANRWISVRSSLKPAEEIHAVERTLHGHRFWVGIPLIAGGLVSIFAMAAQSHSFAMGSWFAGGAAVHMLAIAAEALRWTLIVGGVLGLVVGLMLCLWPEGLRRFEVHANRWISTRQMVRGPDRMHPMLDNLVEAYPRPSGWLFACIGLGVAAGAAVLLVTH